MINQVEIFLLIIFQSIDDQHTVSGITDITLDHGCSVHHIYISGKMPALTGGNCRLGQPEKTLLFQLQRCLPELLLVFQDAKFPELFFLEGMFGITKRILRRLVGI